MKIFAELGTNQQYVAKKKLSDLDIEMKTVQPDKTYIALVDGTWAKDQDLVVEEKIKELDKQLPSWLEDHIKYDHGGKTNIPSLQGIYDLKQEEKSKKGA